MIIYDIYPSVIGPLRICVSDGCITELTLANPQVYLPAPSCHPAHIAARQWLDAYFQGAPLPPLPPLRPVGTAFQQQVWQHLLSIPPGQTVSYGFIARQLSAAAGGKRVSAQAVGQAIGKNPIWIMIPCHRVIGAKGQLTGYAGGLEMKRQLLRHEARHYSQ